MTTTTKPTTTKSTTTTTTKLTTPTKPTADVDIEKTRWRIDPARSSVEFRAPTFWGLVTVKGRFERYDGTLDLRREPAIELTIEADSLDTGNKMRDKHLRGVDFFDAEHHPTVRFASDAAELEGERLMVRGQLHAHGYSTPIELEARVRRVGDELEVDTTTEVDQHELGMTHSPLGMIRTPSQLIVHGRLLRYRA
jgi:polyisoprenoid-binding protein YceI